MRKASDKRRYRYRKKLLRRQFILLNEIRIFHADRLNPNRLMTPYGVNKREDNLKKLARELAGRMVRHGLVDQCLLLDHLVEEVMES